MHVSLQSERRFYFCFFFFFKDVLVGPDRSWIVELLRDLVKTLQFDEKNIENSPSEICKSRLQRENNWFKSINTFQQVQTQETKQL